VTSVGSAEEVDKPIQQQRKGKRRVLSAVAAVLKGLAPSPDFRSLAAHQALGMSDFPFLSLSPGDARPCTCKTTRMCFAQNMTPQETDCLVELVRIVGEILDAEHVAWSPVAGSLLAVYRHDSLVIPWDDDYDIAVLRSDEERALQALRRQLPGRQCKLTRLGSMGPKSWGTMYKASFHVDHPRFSGVLHERVRASGDPYTWPFVDVFIGGTEAGPMGVRSLSDTDLPLRDVTVGDVQLHVPSRGPRCLEEFRRRPDLMEETVEQEHSHRYETHCPCVGPQRMSLARAANLARTYVSRPIINRHRDAPNDPT